MLPPSYIFDVLQLEVVEDASQLLCKNAEKLGVKLVGIDGKNKGL